MLDLYNNQYDRQTLKDNIYSVKLIDILKTQIIDAKFAALYILNVKYQLIEEDNINTYTVLHYQPHITYDELRYAMLNYDSDDDSIDDFETISNKK
jgi:hypothetical protein